jgi:hypothetical protein
MLYWLRSRPRVLGAVAGTLVVGIAIYTLSSVTFPYWPDSSKHPLYEVTFRLLANGYAAPTALGIDGVFGVLPIVLLVAGVTGWLLHRACGGVGTAIAAGVAALVIGLYGLAPRGASADRVYEFVRGAVDPRVGDVQTICTATARSLPSLAAQLRTEGLYGTGTEAVVAAIQRGDRPAAISALRDATRETGVSPCQTLVWLEAQRP